jgi:2-polyprenyl-6-methoxyphenol hydroxylase-like FAD-dependent oxidoreductase
MAIEDAVVLARALADHRRDLDGAFRSYQTKRKERVERVAAAVRKFGRIYNVGHPIRGAVLHTLMRLMSKIRPAAGPFDWVLEYDALSS